MPYRSGSLSPHDFPSGKANRCPSTGSGEGPAHQEPETCASKTAEGKHVASGADGTHLHTVVHLCSLKTPVQSTAPARGPKAHGLGDGV